MNINFEHYKVFYHVARLSSISLASDYLLISQPAVSRTIKLLEQNLGLPLLFRSTKGVQLTLEGKILFEHVSNAYEQISIGEKKIEDILHFEEGELRIGASELTLRYYLLPYLEDFHKAYPKIKISVTNTSTPETTSALRSGKIDFGVVSSPILDKQNLTVHEMCEIQDIVVAGNQFSELKNSVISLEKLNEYPMVCIAKGTSTRAFLDQFFLENNILIEPEFNLATTDLIVPLVKRNLGVGIVTRNFAEESLLSNEIFEVKTVPQIPSRSICLLTGNQNTLSQIANKFILRLIS